MLKLPATMVSLIVNAISWFFRCIYYLSDHIWALRTKLPFNVLAENDDSDTEEENEVGKTPAENREAPPPSTSSEPDPKTAWSFHLDVLWTLR